MKKIIIITAFIFAAVLSVNAQEVYKEIQRMAREVVNDKSKSLYERKIATFKLDELDYMAMKSKELMPDSSVYMLDVQAYNMYDFIDLLNYRLENAKKEKDKRRIIQIFTDASIHNPRFFDDDTELIHAYYNNPDFVTQFSLDTDWVKAVAEVKEVLRKE